MASPSQNVLSIFGKALELSNPAERATFLNEVCGDNVALRAEVDELLAALDQAGGFLKHPPMAERPATDAPFVNTASYVRPEGAGTKTAEYSGKDESVGTVIAGKYKLVESVGEGGMGSVFLAQQTQPVKRLVALKVIKQGMDTKAVLARFDAERQALAMMDHPNIAKVLDAGTTDSGRPFFVMELVKGVPITQFCDDRKLTPRQRLELFVPVCQAIQHAHQKGIIHRDIKPSNVLVSLYDDRPVPKVIDFGIAKAAGPQLTEQTLVTGLGAVVGTPEYMSPEQASFNQLDVDTRSDIYALGVLLYELLTGSTPVDRKSLGKAALFEVLRIVREVEAPRPSNKLSTSDALPSISANRGLEPQKLTGILRGELDWIVLKALEKDRSRRYETANGFAADVQRYLAGEQVQAVPPSAGYRLQKFMRKHRGGVTFAGVLLFALTMGMAGTGWGLVEARNQRDRAETALELEAEQRALVEDRGKALAAKAVELTERTELAETAQKEAVAARKEADLETHDNQRMFLNLAWEAGKNDKLPSILDRMRPQKGKPDLRGFETHFLDRLVHSEIDCTPVRIVSENPQGGTSQQLWVQGYSKGRVAYTYRTAPNQHYFSIDATDRITGKPLAGFEPIRGRWKHQQFASFASAISGETTRLFAAGHYAPSNFEEMNNNKLGIHPPLQQITVWDAKSGKQLAYCERLHADVELQSQGWKHRFFRSSSIMMPLGSNCSRDSSKIITQMVRDANASDQSLSPYESRAVIHDMKTGQVIQRLDARPGVIEFAVFSFDDRYMITSHKQQSSSGATNNLCTIWNAATGKSLWSRTGQMQGFTVDGQYVQFETPVGTPSSDDPDAKRFKVLKLATGEPITLPRGEPISFHPPPPETDWWSFIPRLNRYSTDPFKIWEATNYLPNGFMQRWIDDRGEIMLWGSQSERNLDPPNSHVRVEDYLVSQCRPAPFDGVPCPQLWGTPSMRFRTHENRMEVVIQRQYVFSPFFLAGVNSLDVVDCETGRTRSMIFGPFVPPGIPADLQFSWDTPVLQGNTVIRGCSVDNFATMKKELSVVEIPLFAIYDLQTEKLRFVKTAKCSLKAIKGSDFESFSVPQFEVSLNPDGTRIAWTDMEKNELKFLDSTTGVTLWKHSLPKTPAKPKYYLPSRVEQEPEFSPDGSRLIVRNIETGLIEILDTANGRVIGHVQPPELKYEDERFKKGLRPTLQHWFTPNGRFLLQMVEPNPNLKNENGFLLVIDTRDWTVRHKLELPKPPIVPGFRNQVAPRLVVPQQQSDRYALISTENESTLWNLETGEKCGHYDSAIIGESLINEDGSRLFVLDRWLIKMIDLKRGREVLQLPRRSENFKNDPDVTGSAHHIVLSPDGNVLTTYAANPVSHAIFKIVSDGRPLNEQELANARRIQAIKTRPLPPLRPEEIPAKKEPSTASDFFDRAKQLFGKPAIEATREAIKRDPNFSVLHAHLARALQQDNNIDAALQEFREAVRLEPRDTSSRYEIARILKQGQDYRSAAAEFREIVRLIGDKGQLEAGYEVFGYSGLNVLNGHLFFEIGQTLRESGDLEAAEKALREAVRLEPKLIYIQIELGRCLLYLGKSKEAEAVVTARIKILEEELRSIPKSDQQALNLAQAAFEISSMYLWSFEGYNAETVAWSERAIDLFTAYYKTQPPVPDDQNMLKHARWSRAVGLHFQGKSKEALEELERHSKYLPHKERESPGFRVFHARFVARSGDHAGAAAIIADLLKMPPPFKEDPWFYWNASLAYAQCALAAKGEDKTRVAYEEKAIEMLRKGVADGLPYAPFIRMDPDLIPIRDRADFKAIVAELKRKHSPPQDKK